MTAKEHVLAIYPNAIAHKSQRIARDAKEDQFLIEITDFPFEQKLATISTTFCPPDMIEDVAWEQAWIAIQQQMLDKLAEDPMDQYWREREEDYRLEQEYFEKLREEEREWDQRMYEEMEEKAMARRRFKP